MRAQVIPEAFIVMRVRKSGTINDNDLPVLAQLWEVFLERSQEYLAVLWASLEVCYFNLSEWLCCDRKKYPPMSPGLHCAPF